MSPRFDAHAHFFYPGFVEHLPENCRRLSPDEITLYTSLASQHDIAQVLAVGYEGSEWAAGNNAYLATVTAKNQWVRPVAFVADPTSLTVDQLARWQAEGFVGISLYLFSLEILTALGTVSNKVWEWFEDRAWLLSVNSTGEQWSVWQPILQAHPELRLLISHLGLPPAVTTVPTIDEARESLDSVLRLAIFPQTYVKFSGFYALALPGHAYPHSASLPYAQAISESYGASRILWASDFSPALEFVSFPQTIDVLQSMSWLTESELEAIYGGNLARLLATIDERNPKL